MSSKRARAVLLTIALLVAGVGFGAAVTVLTSSIASPEIGLRGVPEVGELAPPPVRPATVTTPRSRSTPTTPTRTTPTARPPVATSPTVAPGTTTTGGDGEDSEDSGRGRGRNRGRGGDD